MNKNINYNKMHIDEVQRRDISISIISAYDATHGVGRKVKVCTTCGNVHDYYARIDGMTGYADEGHGCHIGYGDTEENNCLLPKEYHSNDENINVNFDGTDNITAHRKPHVSVEFEIYSNVYGRGREAVKKALGLVRGFKQDKAFTRVYLRLLFIGKKKTGRTNSIESDCTVSAEGHVRFRSLQGLQKFLAGCTIEELACFYNVNCGAHIHASCEFAREHWCGKKVFQPVLDKIRELPSDTIEKIFGSGFRYYASNEVGGHGCCINYRTRHNTIEFRLPRIHDTEQYLRVCKWFRAVVACVNGNGVLVNEGIMTPEELGRLCSMIDVRWNKFSKGR